MNVEEEYRQACYLIKGRFVDNVTLLEYQLSLIINHILNKFEPSKVSTDNLHKVHRKKFYKKIEEVEKLMNDYYPNFVKENDTLFKHIEKIKDFRNSITHTLLEVSKKNYRYAKGTPTVYMASIVSGFSQPVVSHLPFDQIFYNIEVIENVCAILSNFLTTEFSDHSL